MNIFNELAEIYFEIDNKYASIEAQSRARRFYRKEAKYQKKRELNDQAFFLFMFARLEGRIKELSIKLIEKKYQTLTNWNFTRTWEMLYNRREENICFLDRVALLTKIGETDFNLIKNYYKQRNRIGHGEQTFTIPINIPTVVTHFTRFYHSLE